MGMGRAATSGFQNATNNVQSGMGGKGGQQPQGGFRGKGGAQQPQGGFGGKGAGQYQPQVQQPQGGFGGKGGQQQNPYAQSYYQPQFQPDTFNNPYAQGGFGQQMGGMGGKGGQTPQRDMGYGNGPGRGQMGYIRDIMQGQPQGGGMNQPQVMPPAPGPGRAEFFANMDRENQAGYGVDLSRYQQPQVQQPQGGFGGKGGQRDTSEQAYKSFMATVKYAPGTTPPTYEQWAAQRQGADKMGPILPKFDPRFMDNKTVPNLMPRRDMGYGNDPRGMIKKYGELIKPQRQGLAALQQPTATTQAVLGPEQPYMGNYLK